MIDTGFSYFNETAVGEGIHEEIENGDVKREDLFIATKLGITQWDRSLEDIVRRTLKRLKIEYLDLGFERELKEKFY